MAEKENRKQKEIEGSRIELIDSLFIKEPHETQ